MINSQSRHSARTVRTKRSAIGVCLWGSDRCADHSDSFAAKDLVEGSSELAVAVVDQEPDPLEQAGEAEVASLLSYPVAGRIGRATGEMDTAAVELDEEQHVEATK